MVATSAASFALLILSRHTAAMYSFQARLFTSSTTAALPGVSTEVIASIVVTRRSNPSHREIQGLLAPR